MKKNYCRFMFVIVFVVGLTISSVFVCAEENVAEIQWEYKTLEVNFANDKYIETKYRSPRGRILKKHLSMLNELGKDGWELCGVNNVNYYFKRVIKEN